MESSSNKDIKHLEETVISPDLKKVNESLSEVVLDSFLDDGLFKDIPLVSTVLGLYRTTQNYKKLRFVKKLHKVLFQLDEVPVEERNNFVKKLGIVEKEDLLRRILYLIDQLDEVEKAEIVGKLLKSYLQGKIDRQDFLRLSVVVNKIYLDDLTYFNIQHSYTGEVSKEKRLQFLNDNENQIHYSEESLVQSGLLVKEVVEDQYEGKRREKLGGSGKGVFLKEKIKISSIGRILLNHGF